MSIPSILSEYERVLNENAALRALVAELEDLIVQLRSQPPSYPKALETRLAEAERLVEQLLNEYEDAAGGPRDQSEEEAVLIHDARAFLAAGDTAKEDGQ